MPLLWLLFPLAAAAIYFSLPKSAQAFGYVDHASGAGGDPLGGADTAPLVDLVGLGEFVVNVSRKIFAMPAAGAPYADAIASAESRYGLPESLLARVLYQESRFRPDIISGETKSPAGALGIAQFMPATARDFGLNPLDARASIEAAARYLAQLYSKFGDWGAALAAYNWGQGNVQRHGIAAAPAETQRYISEILKDVTA